MISMTSFPIELYRLEHYACGSGNEVNRILCFSSGNLVGFLGFWQKDKIPVSTFVKDQFYLNYGVDRYQEIIDTLRYEQPVYYYYVLDAPSNLIIYGYIGTANEPTGEQERMGVPPT